MAATDSAYRHELDVACRVARDAGELLRSMLGDVRQVAFKGIANLVTDADHASEDLIRKRLQEVFPSDRFLGEESTDPGTDGRNGRTWIVDPLDGTTNYAHGFPIFAVSIALAVDGVPQVGVVYAPVLDDLFAAFRGGGASLNEQPISVSSVGRLESAMLATGFAYLPERRLDNLGLWSHFVSHSQAVRRNGAAALDLSWVACGWLDGCWERELSAWDVAAGSLIVTEAGGVISRYSGAPHDLFCGEIVAANQTLHSVMVDEINLELRSDR